MIIPTMRALNCDGVLCDGTHKYCEASRRTCKHARPAENAPGEVDRFGIAMDVIDRVPKLQVMGAHAKEKFSERADRLLSQPQSRYRPLQIKA